jgi:hypothetical protein
MRTLLLGIVAVGFAASAAWAVDFQDCASELREVETAASSAADAADAAGDAKDQLDQARDELKQCLDYPDVYDLLEDGCSSQRSDFDLARDEYNSAVDEYNDAASTFAATVKRLQFACH